MRRKSALLATWVKSSRLGCLGLLRRGCAVAAPRLRQAAPRPGRGRAVAAPWLRYGCAVAAPWLRRGCAVAALWLRRGSAVLGRVACAMLEAIFVERPQKWHWVGGHLGAFVGWYGQLARHIMN